MSSTLDLTVFYHLSQFYFYLYGLFSAEPERYAVFGATADEIIRK